MIVSTKYNHIHPDSSQEIYTRLASYGFTGNFHSFTEYILCLQATFAPWHLRKATFEKNPTKLVIDETIEMHSS